ncbi:MAG: amidohydrolase [Acidobacteria bacterium]|nr:MAG: amidohydrolase [Acidobacteriota bacterium]
MNDAHCHFFSSNFFSALARQRLATAGATTAQAEASAADVCRELQWDDPRTADALSDRWVAELDEHRVTRAALIASVPTDEVSVAEAVAHHPSRFVGFFMVDPAASDALDRTRRAVEELRLRTICLFPAMQHVPLGDDRTVSIVEHAASRPGTAVFVHCGVLSVGVRAKLGLPSRFDMRLGNPLDVSRLALAFPTVPFIIPHFGAGVFREALMAADICPNIHLDTSSSNGWIKYMPGLTLEAVFKAALAVAGPSRLLFGTDSSFFPRGWQNGVYDTQQQIVDRLGISTADAALIFGGNFDRLFP